MVDSILAFIELAVVVTIIASAMILLDEER